jgi:hypothetical protein
VHWNIDSKGEQVIKKTIEQDEYWPFYTLETPNEHSPECVLTDWEFKNYQETMAAFRVWQDRLEFLYKNGATK